MSRRAEVHRDVIVLVPGFLGFSVVGQFPYFADRVPAVLSALFRETWGRLASVIPASTMPAGRLRNRLENLSTFLRLLAERGAERFHLVGHSTGGLDAQLLMSRVPHWGGSWPAHVADVRARVRSVVTISAPHYGTSLLASAAARFVAHPLSLRNVRGARPLLGVIAPLAYLAYEDLSQLRAMADVSALQFPDLVRFVNSVLRHHELLDELTPESMTALRHRIEPDPRALPTCFVTGADPTVSHRASDRFYAVLNALGRLDEESALPPDVGAAVQRIASADEATWIRNPTSVAFRVGPATNDGIVNTARQLLPEGALGGIVVGDHADVLGHYDRIDVATGKALNTGVFRSGAGFGDDEFTELYRRVSRALRVD